MFGAAIVFISVVWYLTDLPKEGPLNAGDGIGVLAAIYAGRFCASLGFLAGLLCAVYLWARWSLFQDKPE
jgi:hypothetical protein